MTESEFQEHGPLDEIRHRRGDFLELDDNEENSPKATENTTLQPILADALREITELSRENRMLRERQTDGQRDNFTLRTGKDAPIGGNVARSSHQDNE